MSTNRKAEQAQRQARIAAIKAEQQKAERKRNVIVGSVAGALVLGLVGTTAFVVVNEGRKNAAEEAELAARAEQPIEGLETFEGLTQNHVTGPVDYAQDPPVGGDHASVWQNCGFYAEPVADENAVHSLEHGAGWITHDPALPESEVALLRAYADDNNFVLVSPRDGLPSPIVASTWGLQLQLDKADDDRLAVFLQANVRGPGTPEPGAVCTGGVGTPG
ncbi:DUF3105 domain-containing protein [Cellulomonas fimi]|uniref:DUF3105 domain-containing protein n=1 Tax=Cellulomonas fimi TaxID=1708 RepID=A0A7Y0LX16_CELFI|nr:DUF3105 domain-containing protein [Cellulomonas fimi]NMR19630.1 DUF3105 domain-containing protein [Cellulomonas fimi]